MTTTPKRKPQATAPRPRAAREPLSLSERKPRSDEMSPVLRFTPEAWGKLVFLRDVGETEVGGFGICGGEDLLRVTDFVTVKQNVSVVSVEFDDEAVADLFDEQIDFGRRPEQFARIWVHTHPGQSATPSATDENCFRRVFGGCDWAVMFILGRTGETYARLRFGAGPGGQIRIPVELDFTAEFDGSDRPAWEAEYEQNIRTHTSSRLGRGLWQEDDPEGLCVAEELMEELDQMDPAEREAVLAELQARDDFREKEDAYV